MCEEKRQANDVASDRSSCYDPAMEQKMRTVFASMGGEREDDTGSCADRMAEMMKDCRGGFTGKDKSASAEEVSSTD